MKMAYQNQALCPLCKTPLEIEKYGNVGTVGEVVYCICPHCGCRQIFSADCVPQELIPNVRDNPPDQSANEREHDQPE